MRLIDADALIEDVDGDLTDSIAEGRAIEKIMNAPTIEERKMGEWMERNTHFMGEKYGIEEWQSARCSVCEKIHTTPYMYFFDDFKFCPNCGADMRGDNHETDRS